MFDCVKSIVIQCVRLLFFLITSDVNKQQKKNVNIHITQPTYNVINTNKHKYVCAVIIVIIIINPTICSSLLFRSKNNIYLVASIDLL